MNKILIIPDVHGRTFWKKAEELINQVDKVVFLGDYLDPYPLEGICPIEALNNFYDILSFKKKYNDKVILLIGNHDLHYFGQFLSNWGCRRDELRKTDISHMFQSNIDLFNVAFETYINGKQYLFTHAGVLKPWFEWVTNKEVKTNPLDANDSYRYSDVFGLTDEEIKSIDVEMNAEGLNKLLHTRIGCNVLWTVSKYRGGWGAYGSCLWADIHEHFYEDPIPNIYQIFGHTMTYPTIFNEYIGSDFAMLDSQHCYILSNGKFQKIVE